MCGVYHGCAENLGPKKIGRHHVIGSPSRPRAPKISRMTSLAAHAPFIGCTCAVHGAIIPHILLMSSDNTVQFKYLSDHYPPGPGIREPYEFYAIRLSIPGLFIA